MSEIRKAHDFGDSVGITIPSSWVKELGIKKGDYINLSKNGEKITIKKIEGQE